MINFPEYIECELVAVSVDSVADRQDVLFKIIDHQEKEHRILARSVKYFSLEAMRLRNVIENVSLYNAIDSQCDRSEVEEKIFFLLQGRGREEKDKGLLFDVISRLSEDIAHGRMVLLEIVALYGADILLLGEEISITKQDDAMSQFCALV